jgi:hypothetical protein
MRLSKCCWCLVPPHGAASLSLDSRLKGLSHLLSQQLALQSLHQLVDLQVDTVSSLIDTLWCATHRHCWTNNNGQH